MCKSYSIACKFKLNMQKTLITHDKKKLARKERIFLTIT